MIRFAPPLFGVSFTQSAPKAWRASDTGSLAVLSSAASKCNRRSTVDLSTHSDRVWFVLLSFFTGVSAAVKSCLLCWWPAFFFVQPPVSSSKKTRKCAAISFGVEHNSIIYRCGGSGCDNLPGGAAACCSDVVLIEGARCNGTEVVAPCIIGSGACIV